MAQMQLAFLFESVTPAQMHVPQHVHEVLEFVYYARGCGTSTIDRTLHYVCPGVFTITPSGLSHDQVNHTEIASICLGLPKSPLERFVGSWPDHSGDMGIACQKLLEETQNYGIENNRVFAGLLMQVIALAERRIRETPALSRHELLIAQARALIRQHAGCITVAELAEKLHVSASHLRHLFTKYADQSPAELIIRARLEHAVRLLADPQKSIQEVAYACGFSSPYYFSRFFKERTGAPPSQIRDHIIGLDKK
ncbi:MAG TPA: helix-turn-helix transcriptional regulator [Candidatus Hydrogenedentes bacterium]|nr:helix-turn-helix transcriptional regulator [Candidatus Hydrogenedentota bacterium]HOL77043.1 helix-turn-helix transcriptional regulator [Candidatus Hydrogenedentota bacterium]HPO85774.1 helix-turn-helix transcriptional regulator [Candidatus Hydrogenedentota bacterium]